MARLRRAFLEQAAAQGRRVVVVDVPLLIETAGAECVDLVLVVSAGEAAQRARALSRPGMSVAKFDAILARQTPDREKRRLAHWVIDTSGSMRANPRAGRLACCARSPRCPAGDATMREIVLDTETTGLDPAHGHRLVEIGAVEIVNQIATGAMFHALINPEREVPDEAFRIHGHSTAFLSDKPVFAAIVDEFLAFVGEDRLVIHNAEFDMRFLNAELSALGRPPIAAERVIDTLALARRKHPGAPDNLDALCDRYRIDRSRRVRHGALLDAEILVEVYGELTGGRQRSLSFAAIESGRRGAGPAAAARRTRPAPARAAAERSGAARPSRARRHARRRRDLAPLRGA